MYICHTASREFINNIHRGIPDFSDHLLPEKEKMTGLIDKAGFSRVEVSEEEDAYLAVGFK